MFGEPGSRSSLSLDLDMSWGIVLQAYRCLTTDGEDDARHKNPLQEWGEEVEDGAVYGVTLRRVRTERPSGDLLVTPCSPGYVHYKTCKVRSLRAGTMEKLVENLVVEYQGTDVSYVPTYLSTYRAFTSAEKVLELLLDRRLERLVDKESASPGSPVPDTASVQRVVRGLLQTWLERHPQDFRDSPQCLQLIYHYLSKDSRETSSQLLRLIKSLEEEGEQDPSQNDWRQIIRPAEGDCETLPNSTSLLSYPPQDVAEQLTLIDVETGASIYLWSLVNQLTLWETKHPFIHGLV